ncbi:MAG: hypothetical protein JRD89_17745, partial [Deltaproteobacteria bacterium]|nr:hypothetical protein [Deltaproteobacteria bacterium]
KKKISAKKSAPKKKRGGQRKPIDDDLRVAGSMKAASAAWELPIDEIKRAKNLGCAAFVGSKVYRDVLIKWFRENPPEEAEEGEGGKPLELADRDEVERRKSIRQVERLDVAIKSDKHKLAVTKEIYIPRELVNEQWTRLWAIIEEEAKGLMDKSVYPIFVARVKAKIK